MPKLKLSEEELKNRILLGLIAQQMELCGLKEKDIATTAHFANKTYYNRRARPQKYTLEELRRLFKKFKLSEEEKGTNIGANYLIVVDTTIKNYIRRSSRALYVRKQNRK